MKGMNIASAAGPLDSASAPAASPAPADLLLAAGFLHSLRPLQAAASESSSASHAGALAEPSRTQQAQQQEARLAVATPLDAAAASGWRLELPAPAGAGAAWQAHIERNDDGRWALSLHGTAPVEALQGLQQRLPGVQVCTRVPAVSAEREAAAHRRVEAADPRRMR